METAILERFDASLADAVRKRSDSEELLERLQHFDALLIPLDDAREWFRYHHLFADFLCQRLRRSSAHRPILLHRRAARALAAVGPKPDVYKRQPALGFGIPGAVSGRPAALANAHLYEVQGPRRRSVRRRAELSGLPSEVTGKAPRFWSRDVAAPMSLFP